MAGACLGGVYEMTKDPIAAANQAAKEAAYRTVFPDAAGFEAADLADKLPAANETIATLGYGNVSVDEAVEATDASGSVAGYVVTATSNDGYGGAVTVSVGIQSDGTVNGIEFLTLAETAGLGMNAQPEASSVSTSELVLAFERKFNFSPLMLTTASFSISSPEYSSKAARVWLSAIPLGASELSFWKFIKASSSRFPNNPSISPL